MHYPSAQAHFVVWFSCFLTFAADSHLMAFAHLAVWLELHSYEAAIITVFMQRNTQSALCVTR
jgi:hypothetical protein